MQTPHSILTTTFLQHLGREESLLRDALANATALHGALRRGELSSAQNFAAKQESLATPLRDAATLRASSANALAREVGLTGETVTLSALAAKLPESLAVEASIARDRLAVLTAELTDIQTRNANLLGHLRSYFRGVLSGLTTSDAPSRYGPSGVRLDSATANG